MLLVGGCWSSVVVFFLAVGLAILVFVVSRLLSSNQITINQSS